MPRRRGTSVTGLSLDELRKLVAEREQVLRGLTQREQSLQRELMAVRQEIAAITGQSDRGRSGNGAIVAPQPKRRGRHGRGVGGQTLADALAEIVRRNGRPMRVGEMSAALARIGHPTRSKNAAKLIAVTIKGSKRFKRVARGLYTAK